jgi:deazaflavin-dependent oxidoreductase (nitroreductase family)
VSGSKGAAGRLVGRTLRMPAALDRPGLRWALNAVSPVPIVVLVHRGRRSGRIYKTPVEALAEGRESGEIYVSPMWGTRSDWYRNVIAGGLIEVRRAGEGTRMTFRPLAEDERREAVASYRRDHPIYSRMILSMLRRLHSLSGDPVEAVVRALPVLALRPDANREPARGTPE